MNPAQPFGGEGGHVAPEGSFMHRRTLLTLALSSAAALAVGAPPVARADDGYRLSGPYTHGNLAIYFVHGSSAPGPVPLTLQEAMAKGAVQVHETGKVNELQIENLGGEEVFVQSGDIVKGGKQDRVLMVSLVLPPKSGRLPIASFCVEQGRWAARGREDVARFPSAETALPSRKAKMAMKLPARAIEPAGQMHAHPPIVPDGRASRIQPPHGRGQMRPGDTGARQQAVWSSVADTQQRLAGALGQSVSAPQSASSLQLSLEHAKLKELQETYVQTLSAEGRKHGDIVGYVFAINGKLNSADIYPSNGLFRKMWPKLLNASVTEAIGERGGEHDTLPSSDTVLGFLAGAERGALEQKDLLKTVRLETREGEKALYVATVRTGGGFVHRNYLAK
jgi:hypothetical protein